MDSERFYPVAHGGVHGVEIFLERNAVGNFFKVVKNQNQYESIDIVQAIMLFCKLPNAVIDFNTAFELQ